MKIAAFNDGHNGSVVLLVDGQIVGALQEERLTRVKNQPGYPQKALAYLLKTHGLQLDDIDRFIFCSTYLPITSHADRTEQIRAYKKSYSPLQFAKIVAKKYGAKKILSSLTRRMRAQPAARAGVPGDKIGFIDHHTCHAASAYFGKGELQKPVLVLTNDGAGDGVCATVRVGERGEMKKLAEIHLDHSVGELWAIMTALMGMVPMEHEYKLMGMAPYAPVAPSEKVRDIFANMFEFEGDGLTWRTASGTPPIPMAYNHLREELEFKRFDWICAGLQMFTEDFLVRWVRNCIAHTGVHDLALAGGTFMNVKLNQRILELPEVDSLYLTPSCGDETNPIGACYLEYFHRTNRYPTPVTGLYLGTSWSDEQVRDAFDLYPFTKALSVERCDDIERRTAELVAEGHVVARFQGAEEFGARALGARSIVADPTKPNVIKEINEMIKSRDFWMPFAASILDTDADRYCVNPKGMSAPYMIVTFDTQETQDVAAGTHPYDGTCRPQVIYEAWNPSYYRLVSEFKKITGRAAVLNTSFNLHGLPIASSPRDAFHVLNESGLSYLAINNFLLSAKS